MTPQEEAALLNDVKTLKASVADLQAARELVKAGAEVRLANRRTRYQEVGQWARHYSTVRMSVTTFLIGLSVTVISFGWNYWDGKPRVSSVLTAALLWLVAVGIFTVFTRLTFKMTRRAADHKILLPVDDKNSRSDVSSNDPASWAVGVISLGFAKLIWWTMDLAWAGGFLAILLVIVLLVVCFTKETKPTAPAPTVVP